MNQFEKQISAIKESEYIREELRAKVKLFEEALLDKEWEALKCDIMDACKKLAMSYKTKDVVCTFDRGQIELEAYRDVTLTREYVNRVRSEFTSALEVISSTIKAEIVELNEQLDDARRSFGDCQ